VVAVVLVEVLVELASTVVAVLVLTKLAQMELLELLIQAAVAVVATTEILVLAALAL
jgi:hypothetical protein